MTKQERKESEWIFVSLLENGFISVHGGLKSELRIRREVCGFLIEKVENCVDFFTDYLQMIKHAEEVGFVCKWRPLKGIKITLDAAREVLNQKNKKFLLIQRCHSLYPYMLIAVDSSGRMLVRPLRASNKFFDPQKKKNEIDTFQRTVKALENIQLNRAMARKIKFESLKAHHNQPAEIDLEKEFMGHFATLKDYSWYRHVPLQSKYSFQDLQVLLEEVIDNIVNEKLLGLKPGSPEYQQIKIMLGQTWVKLKERGDKEELNKLLVSLAFHGKLCGIGVMGVIEDIYREVFDLYEKATSSSGATGNPLLKELYRRTVLETLDVMQDIVGHAYNRNNSRHVRTSLWRDLEDLGDNLPQDPQGYGGKNDVFLPSSADYPKEDVKAIFEALLLPTFVQTVREFGEESNDTKNIISLLKCLYQSIEDQCMQELNDKQQNLLVQKGKDLESLQKSLKDLKSKLNTIRGTDAVWWGAYQKALEAQAQLSAKIRQGERAAVGDKRPPLKGVLPNLNSEKG